MLARWRCWVQCWLLSTRQLASTAMRVGAARARALSCSESDEALPVQCSVQSSSPLQLAAACAVIDRCRRTPRASNQYSFARHALNCNHLDSLDSSSLLGGQGSRRRRRRALRPEPLTTTSEASGLNPHDAKVAGRPSSHSRTKPTARGEKPASAHRTTSAALVRCPPPPWRPTSGREGSPLPPT